MTMEDLQKLILYFIPVGMVLGATPVVAMALWSQLVLTLRDILEA